MNVMTNYLSSEKPNPYSFDMWSPTIGRLSYKMYRMLMYIMGLKRDHALSFWVGGWPVFLLPNGDVFPLEHLTSR